ncbi:MAG TPA: hypothetical protein RMH99_10980 [Sandaracinaceae bacterium LLY-WYZ-13_1]|nr:hypothetical protein [Sandaracinaceae bacterium LLY-WYZ-13_1]
MYRALVTTLIAAALAFSAIGCGGGSWSYEVVGSRRDPGAQGTVQVERIEGGNRLVTVSMEHMTPPDRLSSGLTTYVMWFRDPRGQSTKASILEYSPDDRTARATATTPMSRFRLLVTAERNGNVVEPSENVIFNQRISAE